MNTREIKGMEIARNSNIRKTAKGAGMSGFRRAITTQKYAQTGNAKAHIGTGKESGSLRRKKRSDYYGTERYRKGC